MGNAGGRNYLFVHFKEKSTPDGEQVYFAISRDGFSWTAINEGRPVLWSFLGDRGVRDMTIARDVYTGRFHIFATDLSLAYGLRGKYEHSWDNISRHGSKALAHWESDDLVRWTNQELVTVADDKFGCVWAPDIIFDSEQGDYILHWSSAHACDGYCSKRIYYSRTRDFKTFSSPRVLFELPGGKAIDSAMYEEDGEYYLFIKSEWQWKHVMLFKSAHATGPFEHMPAFDAPMALLDEGVYEGPTAVRLADGKWCLFLDYYGVKGAGQGYVPFVAPSLKSGAFVRSDAAFFFPYRFKHGTVLAITDEEYDRISKAQFEID